MGIYGAMDAFIIYKEECRFVEHKNIPGPEINPVPYQISVSLKLSCRMYNNNNSL